MFKKIAIALAVLVILAGGGIYYMYSNLDFIIKMAVERYGTAATQTTVRLGSVNLSMTSGEGSLRGLSIDNPKNFNGAVKAFQLGSIHVKLDANSLRGTGPIIIREVTIDQPQVNYEITNAGDSNLSAIQKNVQSYTKALGGTAPSDPGKGADGSRKVIINDLYVRNGQVGVSAQLVKGKSFSEKLPSIHLTNIGKSSGGATAAQVTEQLLGSLTVSAAKVATAGIAQNLGGLKDVIPLKGAASDSLTNVRGKLKGILGD
ncbi:MAG: hypothetical protein SFW62_01090 [Alphaproteobacteria bacterium]|nr:hypothetical protein [Alphaproteobacteria bacterium]